VILTTQKATFVPKYDIKNSSCSRVGKDPTDTAAESWNSLLCLLLKMGAYIRFFLKAANVLDGAAKYLWVSLLRHARVRTYLTDSMPTLQKVRATIRDANTTKM